MVLGPQRRLLDHSGPLRSFNMTRVSTALSPVTMMTKKTIKALFSTSRIRLSHHFVAYIKAGLPRVRYRGVGLKVGVVIYGEVYLANATALMEENLLVNSLN